jgi:hypothetical protein
MNGCRKLPEARQLTIAIDAYLSGYFPEPFIQIKRFRRDGTYVFAALGIKFYVFLIDLARTVGIT